MAIGDRVAADLWPSQLRARCRERQAGCLFPSPGAATRHLGCGTGVSPGRRGRELAAGQLDHESGAREAVILPAGRGAPQALASTALERKVCDARVAPLL